MHVSRSRWLVSVTAVVLAASGCGGSGGGAGDRFSVALTEPEHLTPGNTNDVQGLSVADALFDRLMALDPHGTPVPQEAESLTSRDQKVWTARIRPGLRFHNGEPVTAQSYVDAWNTAAYGPNGWGNNAYFSTIDGYDDLNPPDPKAEPRSGRLRGLRVVDERTLRITLAKPFGQLPMLLSFVGTAPLPTTALKDPKGFERRPIGNGPFMMDGRWEHNRRITLTRFAGYRGPRPAHAGGLVFTIYAGRNAAYTDLRAGRVDFDGQIPAAKAPQARRLLGRRFLSVPSGTVDFLEFPLYDKRFADPNLRRAISMAIDRRSIVDAVYNGAFTPVGSLIAPIVPGYRRDACGEACGYDPRRARRLFEEAGGYRGTLHLMLSNADPTYEQWMTDVANQLRQNLGITDIVLDKVQVSDYLTRLTDRGATGPYRSNWTMDYPSAENYLTPRCAPPVRSGYDGAACLDLIKKANAAADPRQARRYYQRAEDLLLADLPLTPLWNWRNQAGYSSRIGNVHVDPYAAALLRLEQVTVD